jgi:hypothetical protein
MEDPSALRMGLECFVLVRDLAALAAPWPSIFNHSAPVEMSVVGVHVLAMLVAGGLAIADDRGTLRAGGWTPAVREHHFAELHAVHRTVVVALAICMFSGVALFATDVATYAVSDGPLRGAPRRRERHRRYHQGPSTRHAARCVEPRRRDGPLSPAVTPRA